MTGTVISVLAQGLIVSAGAIVTPTSVISHGLFVDASSTPTMSISPSSFVESTTGNTVNVTGVNTSWTGGTTFSVTAGSITAQVFVSPTSFALTYTAPGSPQSVTFSNSTDSATANATITGSSPCDYPTESNVRSGVVYASGTMIGNVVLPLPATVTFGTLYGAEGNEFTGTFRCPPPPPPPYPPPPPIVPSLTGAYPYARINQEIVARVAAALGTTVDFVRPVANDDYAVTETENLFAYIRTFGPSPIDPLTGAPFPNIGAGRLSRVVGRRVRVYLYTRSSEDVVGGDEVALSGTDPNQLVTTPPTMPGQFVSEELLLNALDDWTIEVDGTTGRVALTLTPVHWIDSADGPPVRKPESDVGLIRSHLDFSVVYISAIVPTDPAPLGLPVPNLNNS